MMKNKFDFKNFFISKKREVKIFNGGRKVVIYTLRFFGILIYKKTIDFSKHHILDGGGKLQLGLAKAMSNEDYLSEKLPILIKNLDKNSVEAVLKIVNRLKDSYNNFLFISKELFKEEKAELDAIRDNFQNRIFRVNSKKWFYNGYYLPISSFEISVFHHKHSMHVLENLNKLKNFDIIDVGAYVGDSALVLSEYTDKKIYCFEIDKNNFNLLNSTIALNNKEDKILAYNFALGKDVRNIIIKSGGGGGVI